MAGDAEARWQTRTLDANYWNWWTDEEEAQEDLNHHRCLRRSAGVQLGQRAS